MERTVTLIPARRDRNEKNVGIYCRVSSSSKEQLDSLAEQIAALTRQVSTVSQWRLRDTFIDIGSAKGDTPRREFERMLKECEIHNIAIVLTKSISRFGRNTVDSLETLRRLKAAGTRVIFQEENLDTDDVNHETLFSILGSIAQAENETRSTNIRLGLSFRAASGVSGLYKRKTFGYVKDSNGDLIIDKEQANVVRDIFRWYTDGASIVGIIKRLSENNIPSPTGKPTWSKKAVENILSNEKYTGVVRLTDSLIDDQVYIMKDSHPAIITRDVFDSAREEKRKRSNIVEDENGLHRSSRKYSSKQK